MLACAFTCILLFAGPSVAFAQQQAGDAQLSLQAGSVQPSLQDDDQDPATATQASNTPDISWHRVYGASALDTMLEIIKQGNFPKGGCVVLATSDATGMR